MNQFQRSSTLATTLLATIVTLNVPACSQAVGSDEPVEVSSDELFLTGKTWSSNNVYVCYMPNDTSASDIQNLIPEAQRVLAASWSRATNAKFPGRPSGGGTQAAWGPCDLTTSETQDFSTIALHFCGASGTNPRCAATNYDSTGHYRGLSSPIGRVDTSIIVDAERHVTFSPGVTNVFLLNDDPDRYLTHFRYEVIHEFGHALGFAHEQDRPDNNGMPRFCNQNVNPQTGTTETSFFDNESIMSYCSVDPLVSAPTIPYVTNLSSGDISGARTPYGRRTNSHGFMIQTDGNTSLAITPNGAAVAGATLKLSSGCTVTNPNCTWTYQRGLIVSDADPTLAIAGIGNLVGAVTLQPAGLESSTNQTGSSTGRTIVCTPGNSDCTWTYSAGEFLNDHFPKLALNGHGGSLVNAPIFQTAACTTSNGSCTWTLPDVMLTSYRDSTLAINAHGGAIDKAEAVMHSACDTTNNSCTFTFSKGMMKSTGNLALALNAFGGAHEGATALINSSCTVGNASCTWTWRKGQIISDDHHLGTFPLNAVNGAVHLANVRLAAACTDSNPDCVFSGMYAKN